MPLLAEYGLIPDVFDGACYASDPLCDVYLQNLKEALLSDGIVRNLRDGDWLQQFQNGVRSWHMRSRELLRKLVAQNRIRLQPNSLPNVPTNDTEWCNEAIASHSSTALNGIVTTEATSQHFKGNALVAPINKLSTAAWWSSRSPSIRLMRTLMDYEQHLSLIFACANSVMIIDAHLDPSVPRYAAVAPLICKLGGRTPKPLIEIHRVCYEGAGPARRIISTADWINRFEQGLLTQVRNAGLSVKVFIWDDFHDRYIISDLIGIGMQNGLDTSAATNAKTTWHRLGRRNRDDIQREFDIASQQHSLRDRPFTIQ